MKVFCIGIVIFACLAVANAGKINVLPGYTGPPLSMYSGYITVNQTGGRALFYWMIESQRNATLDPLVFWFNGGPGCSSLDGLFTEHGPLRVNTAGGVDYNSLSWTNVATVVYVESPVGVGFSYTNASGFHPTDNTTALDAFNFIEGFLNMYPQYIGRSTWLSGESYAGVYVPSMAHQILLHTGSKSFQQITGIMVGNGVFRCGNYDDAIDINLLYWHGLVSYTNYYAWYYNNCPIQVQNPTCKSIFKTVIDQLGVIDQELLGATNTQPSLDPDNLYQDFCAGNGTLQFSENPNWPNCSLLTPDEITTAYLNRPTVQSAIFARAGTNWQICNDVGYISQTYSLVPFYAWFPTIKPNFKILVYSGDVDILTVPFAHTQPCLFQLGRPNKQAWAPWTVNGATAGYVEYFDTYTFATIKGAGHEAPEYQPLNSLAMFERFISKQNLTETAFTAPKSARKRFTPTQGKILRKFTNKLF